MSPAPAAELRGTPFPAEAASRAPAVPSATLRLSARVAADDASSADAVRPDLRTLLDRLQREPSAWHEDRGSGPAPLDERTRAWLRSLEREQRAAGAAWQSDAGASAAAGDAPAALSLLRDGALQHRFRLGERLGWETDGRRWTLALPAGALRRLADGLSDPAAPVLPR
jgi:hypothetical protein